MTIFLRTFVSCILFLFIVVWGGRVDLVLVTLSWSKVEVFILFHFLCVCEIMETCQYIYPFCWRTFGLFTVNICVLSFTWACVSLGWITRSTKTYAKIEVSVLSVLIDDGKLFFKIVHVGMVTSHCCGSFRYYSLDSLRYHIMGLIYILLITVLFFIYLKHSLLKYLTHVSYSFVFFLIDL